MRRILVIGCSGSGKTTLARWLARRLNVPLVRLDRQPGEPAPPEEKWRRTVRTLADREAWVMDGTFHATLAERLPTADAVVWLDFPRWRCLARVAWRALRSRRLVRSDMEGDAAAPLDLTYLRFVWDFNAVTRPRIGAVLEQSRHPMVVVLRSPSEVSRFKLEFAK